METILALLASVVQMYQELIPQPVIAVLLFIGSCRLVIKPALSFAYAIVAITPSTKDDEVVKKVEGSKWLVGVQYFLNWVFSLKLPAKK